MGDKNYSRISRINALIKKEIATILLAESKDPRFKTINISEVDTSPDLSFARVYFGAIEKQDIAEIITSLNKAAGFFRKELAKRIDIRTTPRLEFIYDDSTDIGSRINDILFKINQNKKEDNHNDT